MPTKSSQYSNSDPDEVAKFNELANEWWDLEGSFKPLHQINPLRLAFIKRFCELNGKKVLDVGCGGGILTEALAKQGAQATGVDLAPDSLEAARTHAKTMDLKIDYQKIDIETFATHHTEQFDVVMCMELLEHVPDPQQIVNACSQCLKPGGHLFLSTINRNPKAYLFAILAGEYLLNLLPRGTHDYQKFIRPSELANWTRHAGLSWQDVTGISYNPLSKQYYSTSNCDVNYIAHCLKMQ